MVEVRFHGRGGQGAVTAAELLAEAIIAQGRFAQGFPNFGPERRGAPVSAFLRTSDDPIYLREKIEQPDIIVVLDASLIGLVDVAEGLKPGGFMIVNVAARHQALLESYKAKFRIAMVDAIPIALETIGVPIVNTAIIGALVKACGITTLEALKAPFERRFGRLSHKNLKALQAAHDQTTIVRAISQPVDVVPASDDTADQYEECLCKDALHVWSDVPIGCDIEHPGNSAAFCTGKWRTVGRPHTAEENCIKCGICWMLCPDIAYQPDQEGYFRWNSYYCKGCGICAAECPKGAIEMRSET